MQCGRLVLDPHLDRRGGAWPQLERQCGGSEINRDAVPAIGHLEPDRPSSGGRAGVATAPRRGSLGRCSSEGIHLGRGRVVSKAQTRELPYRRNLRRCSELMVSAISCTKLDVASKGAAWPAPSISCVVAVGMALLEIRRGVRFLVLLGMGGGPHI